MGLNGDPCGTALFAFTASNKDPVAGLKTLIHQQIEYNLTKVPLNVHFQ